MTVLYLTQNGVTDHIGQSQIAPYLLGLAGAGVDIHVLSVEKAGREALVVEYRARFAAAGIRWTTVRYHDRPPLIGTLADLIAMRRAAGRITRRERITLIHARSHPTMPVAMLLKRRTGARLLFDFRDFWADGGLVKGRFTSVYRWFKQRERGFVAAADGVNCLTHRAAEHLASRYPDLPPRAGKYSVIPCCADVALFRPLPDRAERRAALGIAAEATVLLYLGSIGPDYLLDDMMRLFVQLRSLRPGAVFLFVVNNGEPDIAAAAARAAVPSDALRVINAERSEVPHWIGVADLSVIFIRADLSKLGCSPTKLAETLACGIPVIANAGFGDIDRILDPTTNGSLALAALDAATMRAGLATVLAEPAGRERIRAAAMAFSLESGISAYGGVYGKLEGTGR